MGASKQSASQYYKKEINTVFGPEKTLVPQKLCNLILRDIVSASSLKNALLNLLDAGGNQDATVKLKSELTSTLQTHSL